MRACTLPIVVAGEELRLHPARAVIWPRTRTVIVADTHFGKSGFFGRHGLAVPAGVEEADRERLSGLLVESQARRLVILGDFLHAPLVEGGPEVRALLAWADRLAGDVELHVIAGNHDRGSAGTCRGAWRWWDAPCDEPPLRFVHDADRTPGPPSNLLFTLSGHVHPVVRLRGTGKGASRVPVFWQRPGGLILPAFGLFTGGFAVHPGEGEQVYAVGSSGVVPLGGG